MKIPKTALPHRVTVIPFKGAGAYGPQWDDANQQTNVPCLIQFTVRRLSSGNGTDVVQEAKAVFHPDFNINQGDKVVWSLRGAEYTVQAVTPIEAMGPHSIETVLI